VGYTPQGKVPNLSSMSFHVEAARNARYAIEPLITPEDHIETACAGRGLPRNAAGKIIKDALR
jgi:hypothetical protein